MANAGDLKSPVFGLVGSIPTLEICGGSTPRSLVRWPDNRKLEIGEWGVVPSLKWGSGGKGSYLKSVFQNQRNITWLHIIKKNTKLSKNVLIF